MPPAMQTPSRISGASGAILGIELLQAMRGFPDWETHLVVSNGGRRTIACETSWTMQAVAALVSISGRAGGMATGRASLTGAVKLAATGHGGAAGRGAASYIANLTAITRGAARGAGSIAGKASLVAHAAGAGTGRAGCSAG